MRYLVGATSLAFTAILASAVTGCGGGGGGGSKGSVAPPITQGGTYTNVGPLSKARVFHSATLMDDGKILIVGGLTGPTAATAEVEILDPSTGAVSSAAPMSTARLRHSAVLLATKKVLVIGGQSDRFGAALATTELYDPVTNAWSAGPNLSTGRAGAAVAAFGQGTRLLVAGGSTWSAGTPQVLRSADIYVVDAFPNRVQASTAQMRTPRADGQAVTQTNNQILLASGYASLAAGTPAPSEVYDIATDAFVPVNMGVDRAEAGLARIDSKLYAIAGVDSSAAALASVELFDGQSYSASSPLFTARAAFTVSELNGQGIVIGGRSGITPLASSELYPYTGAMTASSPPMPQWTATLADERYSHTATVVGDRIYVIGGFGLNDDILASVEVFSAAGQSIPGSGAGRGVRVNGKATTPTGALTAAALSPTSGPVGTTVVITGNGFDSVVAANIVKFNGVQAVVQSVDLTTAGAHKLTVVVPAGATTGAVTVARGALVATGPVFTVGTGTGPTTPPRILFVLPNSARSFIPVSITGQDFGTQPVVTFNGVPSINIINLSTKTLPIIGSVSELITLVPPGATSGPLVITNQGTASNPFYFTVR
jgi:hypothetical protein